MSAAPPNAPAGKAWRRFRRNKPALVGLFIIALAVLAAVGGYWLLPDSSPNANQSVPVLQKKPPGYTVPVFRIRQSYQAPPASWWQHWLAGSEPGYYEIPVAGFSVAKGQVHIEPVRKVRLPQDEPLVVAVSQLVAKKSIFTKRQHTAQPQTRQAIASRYLHERTYWLGTDKAGRDVLSRLLLGTRVSLAVGLLAVLLSVTVGTLAGSVAGYVGGAWDKVILWLMTVVWSVPGIILVIAISLALQQKGIGVLFVAIGLTTWVEVARLVRGEMLALRQKAFVEAAVAIGLPGHRILLRHLLPNLLGPIIVVATANFASAILMEAGLSFLGLGVQPPTPSWGMMVAEGFQLLGTASSWYLVLWPSLCISALVMAFNMVGNGLRDAYDPKTLL